MKGTSISMKIILASTSPRRKEILETAGFTFDICDPEINETADSNLNAYNTAMQLAKIKSEAMLKKYPQDLIISADTVVCIDDILLGKPKNKAEAFEMLSILSGRTHSVYTGVCIAKGQKSTVFYEETVVKFYKLSEEEINSYIDSGEPFDKAGAYGIQGKGSLLVERINGDYFNVVGLPVARLNREIQKLSTILFNEKQS